jgi:hypothetical protein
MPKLVDDLNRVTCVDSYSCNTRARRPLPVLTQAKNPAIDLNLCCECLAAVVVVGKSNGQ